MRDVRMRGFRERRSVEEACEILKQRTSALAPECVDVVDAAGRVAAEEVFAAVDVPHFRRAAMDGYALKGESTFGATAHAPVGLTIVGESLPGRPWFGVVHPEQAVRITTGAKVPDGADAVVMAENAEEMRSVDKDVVMVMAPIPPGKHVGRIGEDIERDQRVLSRGRHIRPQDAGVLASVGVRKLSVVRRPTVRLVITGDELLPPGSTPSNARIVDSNSVMLCALVYRDGAAKANVVMVQDRYEIVRDAIASADEDVVMVSGGSSVGPEDHAPTALAEIGEVAVHGVAMRPSSPAGFGFFGAGAEQKVVFLLPGNPVSCLAAYEFFAGPTVRGLGGLSREWPHRRTRGRLIRKIVSELGRLDYVRVRLIDGRVDPIMTSGAAILSSTTRADGVVIVAAGREGYAEEEEVEILLYD